MYSPSSGAVGWATTNTGGGLVIGMIVTVIACWLLPKRFPMLRQAEAFFWVMLGCLVLTTLTSTLALSAYHADKATYGSAADHLAPRR